MSSPSFDARLEHLRKVAAERHAQYIDRYLMSDTEAMEWRWERYNTQLRIVAAANRYGDFIVVGARHFCVTMNSMIDLIGLDVLHEYAGGPDNEEQGFIDQFGTFHNRRDAALIAIAAGQVKAEDLRGEYLFSEDVW